MAAVQQEARLDRPLKDGGTRRAMLELRASQGSRSSAEALLPIEYPESLGYLIDWTRELVGRSGVGMDGFAPLSWETLDAWAKRTGRNPTPLECSALMALDAVFRRPDDEPVVKADEPRPMNVSSWPDKKRGG